MNDIRVLIIEDEPLIARDVATILQKNEYSETVLVYTIEDAISKLEKRETDLAIVDINLQGEQEGIALAKFINEKCNIPFVYLTSYSDKQTLQHAKLTEPYGYIVKPFSEAGLCAALEIALYNFAQKHNANATELSQEIINKYAVTPLSEREFEIIKLIYEGNTNQQIASTLFVSINTVKKHINNAYLKIEANSRSSALVKLRNIMNETKIVKI